MRAIVNQFSTPMQSSYAGLQYVVPPNSKIVIKNRRERVGDGGDMRVLIEEEIAAKLYDDLGQIGAILLDDDNPEVTDEMRSESRRRRSEWIVGLINEFNDLNAAQASINKPILQVPRHFKALQAELPSLTDGSGAPGFTSTEELEKIRQRVEVSEQAAMKRLFVAQESGDAAAVAEAVAELKALREPKVKSADHDFVVRRAPGTKARGGMQPEASTGVAKG